MIDFKVGDRVFHDFSGNLGNIRIIDNNREYKYFVMWDEPEERSDWYSADVLLKFSPNLEADEKLIIFGWLVTILGVPNLADPTKYNQLTDKLYELMGFRGTEPLQAVRIAERENVPLAPKKPSDGSYEARSEAIRKVLSKHGVLTRDGWEFVTDELVNDLAEVK